MTLSILKLATTGLTLTDQQKDLPIAVLEELLEPGETNEPVLRIMNLLERQFNANYIRDLDEIDMTDLQEVRNFGPVMTALLVKGLRSLALSDQERFNPLGIQKDWPNLLRNCITNHEIAVLDLKIPTTMFCELLAVLGETGD